MMLDSSKAVRCATVLLFVLVALGSAFVFREQIKALFTPSDDPALRQFNANDLAGAVATIEEKIAAEPSDTFLLLQKAVILAQRGSLTFHEKEDGTEAIRLAEVVLQSNPNSDEAWRIIAFGHEIQNEFAAAHAAYEKALALNPNNVAALSGKGHAYDLQGEAARAEEYYRKALAIDPSFEHAQMGLGRMLLFNGKSSDALPLFAQLSESAQNMRTRAEAAYSASSLSLGMNDVERALSFANRAVQIDPMYPLAYVGRGTALFRKTLATSSVPLSSKEKAGLLTQSTQDFAKAIELNPNQTLAYYQMGLVLAAFGRIDDAQKFFSEALAVSEHDITLTSREKKSVAEVIRAALTFIKNRTSTR